MLGLKRVCGSVTTYPKLATKAKYIVSDYHAAPLEILGGLYLELCIHPVVCIYNDNNYEYHFSNFLCAVGCRSCTN